MKGGSFRLKKLLQGRFQNFLNSAKVYNRGGLLNLSATIANCLTQGKEGRVVLCIGIVVGLSARVRSPQSPVITAGLIIKKDFQKELLEFPAALLSIKLMLVRNRPKYFHISGQFLE